MQHNFETIKVALDNGIGRLTWSRPRVHNAISLQVMSETMAALKLFAEMPEARVIVLSGEGASFSAGCDLKESATRGTVGVDAWRTRYKDSLKFMMSFWDCPKPVIASIHGHCLAGAFEAALACDISVASETALFGMPEAKMGSPSILLMLPWLAGPKVSKEILMLGRDTFSARDAHAAGIVNHLVPEEEREAHVESLARELVASSPIAVAYFKRAINQTFEIMGLRAALDANVEAAAAMKGEKDPDREEFARIQKESGLNAAIAWRVSRFTGTL